MLQLIEAPTAFSVSTNPVPVKPACLVSITPELLQNPTAFSSNNQLLSATDDATEEAIDDELLLELLITLLFTLELDANTLELDFDELAGDEDEADEVAAPHRLPFTVAVDAAPLA